MNEASFVERREPDWKRLSYLSDRADAGTTNLKPEEFHEFVRLYRKVSADLAVVRTKSTNPGLTDFLNGLVARAYGLLYRAPRKGLGKAIGEAVATAARTVRKCRWFVLASAALFILSGVFSYLLLDLQPQTREAIIPAGEQELFKHWQSGNLGEHDASTATLMTGMYASHNPFVAIISGSIAAATFGVGTAYMVFENGMVIGALTHEMAAVHKAGFLYASILPHGVSELSGLVVSGAAGFVMGWALIHPGRRKRSEALREAGKDAIVLLLVSVCLMFIAAPFEGFFSFNPHIPSAVKVGVALVEAIVWGLFWTGFARTPDERALMA